MPPCHSSQGQRLCWVPPWGSVPSALPALSLDRSPRAPPLMGVISSSCPGVGLVDFRGSPPGPHARLAALRPWRYLP